MNNPLVQLDPGLFVWTILTFLLLVFVLAKFAWKPLLKMLQDREDMVRSSLEDAEKAKSELERLNEESEAIMAKARSEAQSILADGKAAAEKVKDDIIAKSKEQANKIREDAGNQIQVEKDKAISEIKKEVVNLTLSVAEKLIQKNLSDADNKSLIEESLKKVQTYEA
ncbi:MAG: F0F1 ATP synthase subunit B [Candidatus Marinimicrobia bacterium]|jgi:F-type H+-transporting ATPase subunit b|nr:F0F1 ATP synthase subunit B [Candidatus Neomarinimicrobiota bacterium]MDE0587578.1 F0F1 ATP synthase subunit B [Candidatus Neomarinimicrobiota bacterium]|tara:strand:+ start:4994 stop:5497 length:504 start_codon:yes stop_codon:yes gene_type:complete